MAEKGTSHHANGWDKLFRLLTALLTAGTAIVIPMLLSMPARLSAVEATRYTDADGQTLRETVDNMGNHLERIETLFQEHTVDPQIHYARFGRIEEAIENLKGDVSRLRAFHEARE